MLKDQIATFILKAVAPARSRSLPALLRSFAKEPRLAAAQEGPGSLSAVCTGGGGGWRWSRMLPWAGLGCGAAAEGQPVPPAS